MEEAMALKVASALAGALTVLSCVGLPAAAAPPIADGAAVITSSPDPYALYGLCLPGDSGLGSKIYQVLAVNETLAKVVAIQVLRCQPFSDGGPAKVTCPPGIPYAYCVRSGNDGLGNDVTVGVLKLDQVSNPNGKYSGCSAGTTPRSKLRLARLAGHEPRALKAIVTLSCSEAAASEQTKPSLVPCPKGPDPFRGQCLGTPNDGFGNAVTIGVVSVNGQGDPYGLYGECVTPRPELKLGFASKAEIVTAAGRSIEFVRSIDLLGCSVPGNFPPNIPIGRMEVTSCTSVTNPLFNRYDYCVWGTDPRGNSVFAGVHAIE
jgi:hypothetical protein